MDDAEQMDSILECGNNLVEFLDSRVLKAALHFNEATLRTIRTIH